MIAGIEKLGDAILPTQAPQSGRSKHDRVVAAFIQLAQARVDVAADVFDLQIGTAARSCAARRNEPVPTRAPVREILQGPANQGIARIFALRNRGQRQAGRQIGRHVFQAVNGEIDRAREQRLFDFLGEKALRSDLRKCNVGDLVAGGLDDFDAGLSRPSCSRRA